MPSPRRTDDRAESTITSTESLNKKQRRKLSKRDADAYSLEMAQVRAIEKRRAQLRRRVTRVFAGIVVVAIVAGIGVYVGYRVNLTTYTGPKNMLSGGLLLDGVNKEVSYVPTAALQPNATPQATDLTAHTSTANVVVYLDFSQRSGAEFLTSNAEAFDTYLAGGNITLEIHPILSSPTNLTNYSARAANALACAADTVPTAGLAVSALLARDATKKGFSGLSNAAIIRAVRKAGLKNSTIDACISANKYVKFLGATSARAYDHALPNASVGALTSTPLVLVSSKKYTGPLTSEKTFYKFLIARYSATVPASSTGG